MKIKSFTDLIAWKKAYDLVLFIYKLTINFPEYELYGLTSQLRRAAVSISSNITEGFSRSSFKEKRQFYYMSLGSLTEVQNLLLITKDLRYINTELFNQISKKTIEVSKLINSLIKSLKKRSKF